MTGDPAHDRPAASSSGGAREREDGPREREDGPRKREDGAREDGPREGEDGLHEREESPEATTEATERFGPLAVSRHVKDDGRALILYTLREPSEQAGDPGGHGERAA
ncbi:MAG TPA: hypothetical protein VGI24_05560 [Solirubrobacteraceae bacterium]|jgi:hypothetical protein